MSDDKVSAATSLNDVGFVDGVTQRLQAKVVSNECPFCKKLDWFLMDRTNLTSVLEFFGSGNVDTYTLACITCGFIRQHVRLIVDGKITGDASHGPE